MSEKVGIDLGLDPSGVRSGARAAADALKAVDTQAKAAQRAVAKLGALRIDPKGFLALKKAQQDVRKEQQKLTSGGLLSGIGKGLFGWAGPQGAGRIFSAAVGETLAETFMSAARGAVDVLVAGVKFAFSSVAKSEKLQLGFGLSLGEKEGGAAQADVERFAKMTGQGTERVEAMVLELRRAGLGQDAARQAYATAADISAGSGGRLATEDLVEQLQRIQLKGGITMRQLPGMGIDVNAFSTALGKKLGISKEEALKRAEKPGAIDGQRLMNTITEMVNKRQGGMAGTGAEKYGKTMAGMYERLTDLPTQYLAKFAKSPQWDVLKAKMSDVLTGLDPEGERGQAIMGKLGQIFSEVAQTATELITPESIDLFVTKLKGSLDTAKSLVGVFEDVGKAILTVADYVKKMIDGFRELRDDLQYFNTGKAAKAKGVTKYEEEGGKEDVMKGHLKDLWHGIADVTPELQRQVDAEERRSGRKGTRSDGAVVININSVQNVHPAKDDTQHTNQARVAQGRDDLVTGLERAAKGMGH